MGVEQVDIITELRLRNMHNIVDKIFSYLNLTDLVRVGGVNREWRQSIQDNKRIDQTRTKYIQKMRSQYRIHKENRHRNSSTNLLLSSNTHEHSLSSPLLHSTLACPNLSSSMLIMSPKSRRPSLVPVLCNQPDMVSEGQFETFTTFGRPLDLNRFGIHDEQQRIGRLSYGFSRRTSSQLGVELMGLVSAANSVVSTPSSNFTVCGCFLIKKKLQKKIEKNI